VPVAYAAVTGQAEHVRLPALEKVPAAHGEQAVLLVLLQA